MSVLAARCAALRVTSDPHLREAKSMDITSTYQNFSASVGESVVLLYEENDHVTAILPPGKIDARTIFVYGATVSSPFDALQRSPPVRH